MIDKDNKPNSNDPTLVNPAGGSGRGSGDEPTAAISGASECPSGYDDPKVFPVSNWQRYKFAKFLGEGGMGRVYEAVDLQLNRHVALKFLRGGDPEMSRRFLFEARAQAKLHHPNVCGVYEAGEIEGRLYIAMRLIDGKTLGSAAPGLSLDQKVRIMRDVAEGVHEAHRTGLIHRDIKPGNIMVEKREDSYYPYVTDFGLARDSQAAGATSTGMIVGTPWYMSPEQARGGGASIDRRSDVYSLGATLYSVLAGRPPFSDSSGIDVLMKVLQEDPVPLRSAAPAIPADLATITMKCLEKDPGRRYDSAKAFAEDLQRWLDGEPVLAKPAGLAYTLGKKARKHKALFAATGAAILLALALGVYAVVQKTQSAAQAKAASRFGRIVEEIAAALRYDAMLPLHDITPVREQVRARIDSISRETRKAGKPAKGPGLNAMGRAYLELKEYEQARKYLEEAWEAGYREPDVALAMGEVYGALYYKALRDLERGGGKARQIELRAGLERELLVPALSYLNMAKGKTPGMSPEYVEALIAFYEKRSGEALNKADDAMKRLPWFFEAARLKGDIYLAQATAEWERGNYAEVGRIVELAGTAYGRSIEIARSSAPAYIGLCDCWNMAIYTADPGSEEADAAYSQALKICSEALAAEPMSAGARNSLANAHKRWATILTRRGEDPTGALKMCALEAGEAARLDPEFAYAHLNIGVSRRMLGEYLMEHLQDPSEDFSLAMESLGEAKRLDPTLLHAANNIGMIWASIARWEAHNGREPEPALQKAKTEYEQALKLDPDFRPARDNLEKLEILRINLKR